MKLPKDRPLNAYLINQYKQQEKRITRCGCRAWALHHINLEITQGTYFSTRFKR